MTLPREQPSLAQLQEETRALHAHLKAYERDFQRVHGRQVMHQEDILPVSAEYRRYKDLKSWIKQWAGGGSGPSPDLDTEL